VALGDSVSAGFGAGPGHGFVELYFSYLAAPERGGLDRLSNLAVPGETSGGMRVAGGQLARALTAIDAADDTRVVTLDIGGNDARGSCSGGVNAPACGFVANYGAIVDELALALARDPGDELFQVMPYYNPYVGTTAEDLADAVLLGTDRRVDCGGTGDAVGFDDVIACRGAAAGATAVDPYATFRLGGQALLADSIHPNELGHAYLACLFAHPERAGSANPCEPPEPPEDPAPPAQPQAPPPATTPPAASASADHKPPAISIRRAGRQRLLARRGVVLLLRSDEDAAVTAAGSIAGLGRRVALRPARLALRSSSARRVRLALPPRARGRVLRATRRLTARVTIRATDAAGNTARVRRTLRVVP
jgi:GDSL-like Lipase/Acylhydrolase family